MILTLAALLLEPLATSALAGDSSWTPIFSPRLASYEFLDGFDKTLIACIYSLKASISESLYSDGFF